jgi:hypothetical protein
VAAAGAIQVADDTLKRLADTGLADVPMAPKPDVTVGPLDREADGPRLNWFLYRVAPNAAYRNMEPPRTGSTSRRGKPPLALDLHYLLTAFPAAPTSTGDQEQTAHIALAAAMRRLHENPVVANGSAFLPVGTPNLHEPLRIALETLDLETLSKVWTAAAQPLRLSVGYVVTVVMLDALVAATTGPPVRVARSFAVPSLGPRLVQVAPPRFGGPADVTVTVTGAPAGTAYVLAAEPGDPAPVPAGGWPMTRVADTAQGVVLRLPRNDLRAGTRRLDAVATVEGLPFGRDSIGVTVVPVVLGTSLPVASGSPVTLATAHTGPDTEVFVAGRRVATSALTATSVRFTVPAGSPGTRPVMLRANRVAGPPYDLVVTA